jgi:hypothetical protein
MILRFEHRVLREWIQRYLAYSVNEVNAILGPVNGVLNLGVTRIALLRESNPTQCSRFNLPKDG